MPRAMCVGKSLCYSGTASIRHLDERLFGRAGIGSHSMSDRLCRMQMMIALPYGVVGVFYFSFGLCQDFKLSKDSLQFACLMGTLFASLTVLSVWRRYVHWSGLRVSSTVALSLLMIGQVVVWKPIWSTTQCAVEEYQKFGQSGSCLGLWMGSCALVWWAEYFARTWRQKDVFSNRRHRMNLDSARLMIAWSLAFLLPGFFFLSWAGLEIFTSLSEETEAFICYAVCALMAIGTWLTLWRKRIAWELKTVVSTAALVLIFLLSSATVLLPRNPVSLPGPNPVLYTTIRWTFPLLAAALWFAGTAWLWRSDRIDLPAGLASESDLSSPHISSVIFEW